MSNSITNYLSNVLHSVKFAAVQTVEEQMPVTGNFITTTKETVKEIYRNVIESKQKMKRIEGVQENAIFKKVNQMFTNIKTDLKSGKFYHPEREDPMEMLGALGSLMEGLGGAGDDFGDLSSLLNDMSNMESMDAAQEPKPEHMVTRGDAMVATAVFKAENRTSNCIGQIMAQLHEHDVRDRHTMYTTTSMQAQRDYILQQNIGSSMTEGFNRLIEFNNEIVRVHVENSQKFYTEMIRISQDSNSIIHALHDMQTKLHRVELQSIKDGKEDPEKENIDFEQLFKNGFNPQMYYSILKQRFPKTMIGMLWNFVGMIPMMLNQFVQNPLHEFSKALFKGIVGGVTMHAMKRLDKSIAGAFATAAAKLDNYGKKVGSGFTGGIASFLGMKQEQDTLSNIDISKYNKGALSWNGIAQKALVEVIPSHLARIEATLTGEGERYMNYTTGKFNTIDEIRKQLDRIDIESIKTGIGPEIWGEYNRFVNTMEQLVEANRMTAGQLEEMQKQFMTGFIGVMERGVIDYEDMLKNPQNYGGIPVVSLLKPLLEFMDQSDQLYSAINLRKGNQQRNAMLHQSIESGNPLGYILNRSTVGSIDRKAGILKDMGVGSPLLTDLTQLSDKRGFTLYDYQYNILKELRIMNDRGIVNIGGSGTKPTTPPPADPNNPTPLPSTNKTIEDMRKAFDQQYGKENSYSGSTSKENQKEEFTQEELAIRREEKRILDNEKNARTVERKGLGTMLDEKSKETTDALLAEKLILSIQNPNLTYEEKMKRYMMLEQGVFGIENFQIHQDSQNRTQVDQDLYSLIIDILAKGAKKRQERNNQHERSFLSFLGLNDEYHYDKYTKLPDGITEDMPFIDQLLQAGDIGSKFTVIKHNLDALIDAPAATLAGVLSTTERTIYQLLFGKEAGPYKGKSMKSLFGSMIERLQKEIAEPANGFFNSILSSIKEFFTGNSGLVGWLKDFVKDQAGVDLNSVTENIKTKEEKELAKLQAREQGFSSESRTAMEIAKAISADKLGEYFGYKVQLESLEEEAAEVAKARAAAAQGAAFGLENSPNSKLIAVSPGEAYIPKSGEGIIKNIPKYGFLQADIGSTVINANENPFNPNRGRENLESQSRNEQNLIRSAYGRGRIRPIDYIRGYAEGGEVSEEEKKKQEEERKKRALEKVLFVLQKHGATKEELEQYMNAKEEDRPEVLKDLQKKLIDREDERFKKLVDKLRELGADDDDIKSIWGQPSRKRRFDRYRFILDRLRKDIEKKTNDHDLYEPRKMERFLQNLSTAGLTSDDLNRIIDMLKKGEDPSELLKTIVEEHREKGDFTGRGNRIKEVAMPNILKDLRRFLSETNTNQNAQRIMMTGVQTKKVKNKKGEEVEQIVLGDKVDKDYVRKHITNQENVAFLSAKQRDRKREMLADVHAEDLMESDEKIDQKKFAAKEGPITGFRQMILQMTGTDPIKAMERTRDYFDKNLGNMIKGGAAGALLSTVFPLGGPLMGALVGASLNILNKSETFNSFMFGGVVGKDEHGKLIRDDTGMFSAKTKEVFQRYLPDAQKYGTIGTIAGLITPFGPLGGAMIGVGASIIKNNYTLHEALFGDKGGLLNADRKKRIKKALPHMTTAALGTLFLGPFGLLGNAVLGTAIGFMSTSEMFKKLMLGPKGRDGIRRGGIAGAIRRQIVDPFKETMVDIRKNLGIWFRDRIFRPVEEGLRPLGRVALSGARQGMNWLFDKVSNFITGRMQGWLPKTITSAVNSLLGGVREAGGFGKFLVKKLGGGTLEAGAKAFEKFGKGVEEAAVNRGWVSGYDAKTLAEVYDRMDGGRGNQSNFANAVRKMNGMKDINIAAMSQLLSVMKSNIHGDVATEIGRLQNRNIDNLAGDINLMADESGLDARSKAAISTWAGKLGNEATFQDIMNLGANDRLDYIKGLMNDKEIPEEMREKIARKFLSTAETYGTLKSYENESQRGTFLADARKEIRRQLGIPDAVSDQEIDKMIDSGGLASIAQNTLTRRDEDVWRANKDKADEDKEKTPSEKLAEIQEKSVDATKSSTEAMISLTNEIKKMNEYLTFTKVKDEKTGKLKYKYTKKDMTTRGQRASIENIEAGARTNHLYIQDQKDQLAQELRDGIEGYEEKDIYDKIYSGEEGATAIISHGIAQGLAGSVEATATLYKKVDSLLDLMSKHFAPDFFSGTDTDANIRTGQNNSLKGAERRSHQILSSTSSVPSALDPIIPDILQSEEAIRSRKLVENIKQANAEHLATIEHNEGKSYSTEGIRTNEFDTQFGQRGSVSAWLQDKIGWAHNRSFTRENLKDKVRKMDDDKLDDLIATAPSQVRNIVEEVVNDEKQRRANGGYKQGFFGSLMRLFGVDGYAKGGKVRRRNIQRAKKFIDRNSINPDMPVTIDMIQNGNDVFEIDRTNSSSLSIIKSNDKVITELNLFELFERLTREVYELNNTFSNIINNFKTTNPILELNGSNEVQALPAAQETLALPPAQEEDKEIIVNDGAETITKVKSGTDGSIMVPPTKENKQALDKIKEREETQNSIADFLRKIYNKISGKTEEDKEEKKKGILDYIMDFIKSPLGFIGGLLKKGAGMLFGFLNTKLFSPLKTMVVGFGATLAAGITKLTTPITSGITGVLQTMFKGITSALESVIKGITSVGGGIGKILTTVGASLMKNKKIALSLAGMGWIGSKIYNAFFGEESPEEQKVTDQYRMWNRVGSDPNLMNDPQKLQLALANGGTLPQQEQSQEDGRTLLGGAAASTLGMVAGGKLPINTHLGRGVGGALAGAAYDYYHTGELPDASTFATDVAFQTGLSYASTKIFGASKATEEAKEVTKAAEEASKVSKIGEIITNTRESLANIFAKLRDKLPEKAKPSLGKVFQFIEEKVLTPQNVSKALPKITASAGAGAATLGIGTMVVQGVFALAAFYEGFKIQITARAFNTLPKDVTTGMRFISAIVHALVTLIPIIGLLIPTTELMAYVSKEMKGAFDIDEVEDHYNYSELHKEGGIASVLTFIPHTIRDVAYTTLAEDESSYYKSRNHLIGASYLANGKIQGDKSFFEEADERAFGNYPSLIKTHVTSNIDQIKKALVNEIPNDCISLLEDLKDSLVKEACDRASLMIGIAKVKKKNKKEPTSSDVINNHKSSEIVAAYNKGFNKVRDNGDETIPFKALQMFSGIVSAILFGSDFLLNFIDKSKIEYAAVATIGKYFNIEHSLWERFSHGLLYTANNILGSLGVTVGNIVEPIIETIDDIRDWGKSKAKYIASAFSTINATDNRSQFMKNADKLYFGETMSVVREAYTSLFREITKALKGKLPNEVFGLLNALKERLIGESCDRSKLSEWLRKFKSKHKSNEVEDPTPSVKDLLKKQITTESILTAYIKGKELVLELSNPPANEENAKIFSGIYNVLITNGEFITELLSEDDIKYIMVDMIGKPLGIESSLFDEISWAASKVLSGIGGTLRVGGDYLLEGAKTLGGKAFDLAISFNDAINPFIKVKPMLAKMEAQEFVEKEDYSGAIKHLVTSQINKLRSILSDYIPASVKNTISAYAAELSNMASQASNIEKGINKLSNGNRNKSRVFEVLFGNEPETSTIKKAFLDGQWDTKTIFNISSNVATEPIRKLAGLVHVTKAMLPFIIDFISEKDIINIVVKTFGEVLGVDKATLNKLSKPITDKPIIDTPSIVQRPTTPKPDKPITDTPSIVQRPTTPKPEESDSKPKLPDFVKPIEVVKPINIKPEEANPDQKELPRLDDIPSFSRETMYDYSSIKNLTANSPYVMTPLALASGYALKTTGGRILGHRPTDFRKTFPYKKGAYIAKAINKAAPILNRVGNFALNNPKLAAIIGAGGYLGGKHVGLPILSELYGHHVRTNALENEPDKIPGHASLISSLTGAVLGGRSLVGRTTGITVAGLLDKGLTLEQIENDPELREAIQKEFGTNLFYGAIPSVAGKIYDAAHHTNQKIDSARLMTTAGERQAQGFLNNIDLSKFTSNQTILKNFERLRGATDRLHEIRHNVGGKIFETGKREILDHKKDIWNAAKYLGSKTFSGLGYAASKAPDIAAAAPKMDEVKAFASVTEEKLTIIIDKLLTLIEGGANALKGVIPEKAHQGLTKLVSVIREKLQSVPLRKALLDAIKTPQGAAILTLLALHPAIRIYMAYSGFKQGYESSEVVFKDTHIKGLDPKSTTAKILSGICHAILYLIPGPGRLVLALAFGVSVGMFSTLFIKTVVDEVGPFLGITERPDDIAEGDQASQDSKPTMMNTAMAALGLNPIVMHQTMDRLESMITGKKYLPPEQIQTNISILMNSLKTTLKEVLNSIQDAIPESIRDKIVNYPDQVCEKLKTLAKVKKISSLGMDDETYKSIINMKVDKEKILNLFNTAMESNGITQKFLGIPDKDANLNMKYCASIIYTIFNAVPGILKLLEYNKLLKITFEILGPMVGVSSEDLKKITNKIKTKIIEEHTKQEPSIFTKIEDNVSKAWDTVTNYVSGAVQNIRNRFSSNTYGNYQPIAYTMNTGYNYGRGNLEDELETEARKKNGSPKGLKLDTNGFMSLNNATASRINFNKPGDTIEQTAKSSACGPATVVNTALSQGAKVDPMKVIEDSRRLKEQNGGTPPSVIQSQLKSTGLQARNINGESQAIKELDTKHSLAVMGRYGSNNPHWMTITGKSKDNKYAVVQDSDSKTPNRLYDLKSILKNSSFMISAGRSKYGLGGEEEKPTTPEPEQVNKPQQQSFENPFEQAIQLFSMLLNPFAAASSFGGADAGNATVSSKIGDINLEKGREYANSMVGNTGFGNNGCTEFVRRYLMAAGSPMGQWMTDPSPIMDQIEKAEAAANEYPGDRGHFDLMWVPTIEQWAKQQNYWKDVSQGGSEGDVVITNNGSHVIIADGKGGYWGNSSSLNQIVHKDSIAHDYGETTRGYVTTGSGNSTVSTSDSVRSVEEMIADGGSSNIRAMGRSKYGMSKEEQIEPESPIVTHMTPVLLAQKPEVVKTKNTKGLFGSLGDAVKGMLNSPYIKAAKSVLFGQSKYGQGDVEDRRAKVWNWLTSNGMNTAAAAGVMGNIEQEDTPFDPTIIQDPPGGNANSVDDVPYGAGYGLVQYTDPTRRGNLSNWTKEHGLSSGTIEGQLGFVKHETTEGDYKGVWDKMNKQTDPSEAAKVWEEDFEAPGSPNSANRISAAQKYYQEYANGQFIQGSNVPQAGSNGNKPKMGGLFGKLGDAINKAINSPYVKAITSLLFGDNYNPFTTMGFYGNTNSGGLPIPTGNQSNTQTPTEIAEVPEGGSAKDAMLKALDNPPITSPYGPREFGGTSEYHNGIDFGIDEGTPLPALVDAVVDGADYENGYGNYVILKDSKGYYHIYGHMREPAKVQVGQQVQKGQIVGISGTTGRSSGPHLHYGIFDPQHPQCLEGKPPSTTGSVDPGSYNITGLSSGSSKYGKAKATFKIKSKKTRFNDANQEVTGMSKYGLGVEDIEGMDLLINNRDPQPRPKEILDTSGTFGIKQEELKNLKSMYGKNKWEPKYGGFAPAAVGAAIFSTDTVIASGAATAIYSLKAFIIRTVGKQFGPRAAMKALQWFDRIFPQVKPFIIKVLKAYGIEEVGRAIIEEWIDSEGEPEKEGEATDEISFDIFDKSDNSISSKAKRSIWAGIKESIGLDKFESISNTAINLHKKLKEYLDNRDKQYYTSTTQNYGYNMTYTGQSKYGQGLFSGLLDRAKDYGIDIKDPLGTINNLSNPDSKARKAIDKASDIWNTKILRKKPKPDVNASIDEAKKNEDRLRESVGLPSVVNATESPIIETESATTVTPAIRPQPMQLPQVSTDTVSKEMVEAQKETNELLKAILAAITNNTQQAAPAVTDTRQKEAIRSALSHKTQGSQYGLGDGMNPPNEDGGINNIIDTMKRFATR